MELKTVPLKVKAGPDDGLGEGQFIGYASVFGNVDSYGDIVQPGAFADTLTEWAGKGDPIPVLWGHDMFDPFSNIGAVMAAEEDDNGLKVTAQLDLESPKAMQVYRLLKGRRVSQMSFAYDVIDSEQKDDGNHLRKLKLYEVSVVPIGANQETEILAVKSHAAALAAGVKEGRVLATRHIDSLRAAQEAIGNVIKAAEGASDPEKASTGRTVKDEEPSQAKSEEPSGEVSVDARAQHIRLLTLKGLR